MNKKNVLKQFKADIKTFNSNKKNSQLIKDNKVQVGNPVKVNTNGKSSSEQQDSIKPIINDGRIVGVHYKCTCGREKKIMFQYNN